MFAPMNIPLPGSLPAVAVIRADIRFSLLLSDGVIPAGDVGAREIHRVIIDGSRIAEFKERHEN